MKRVRFPLEPHMIVKLEDSDIIPFLRKLLLELGFNSCGKERLWYCKKTTLGNYIQGSLSTVGTDERWVHAFNFWIIKHLEDEVTNALDRGHIKFSRSSGELPEQFDDIDIRDYIKSFTEQY